MKKKQKIFFKKVVKELSKLSTCGKYHVGAIITKDGRIVSTGYNGTPEGFIHCKDDKGGKVHSKYEVHAEQNAIGIAARNGVSLDNSIMFCTHLPCMECAKLIITCGIKEVYYIEDYIDKRFNDRSIGFFNLTKKVIVEKI